MTKENIDTTNENVYKIVAISACTAGVAHTYIAEENLLRIGEKLGYKMRVETQGTVGKEHELTQKEIMEADLVIIATDVKIDLDRFKGKKLYQTNVKKAVHNAEELIGIAIKKAKIYNVSGEGQQTNEGDAGGKQRFISHILTGISWMIPVAIAASIMIAIPGLTALFTGNGEMGGEYDWTKMVKMGLTNDWWKLMWLMIHMGWASISLLIPVFAAFVAYSIGDRPAWVPGFIGGLMAKPSMFFLATKGTLASKIFGTGYPYILNDSGFWGAIIIAIVVGYSIKYINKYMKLPKTISSIKPMLLLPMIGVLIVIVTMVFVVNPIFGAMNNAIINGIKQYPKLGKYAYAIVIAPLTAFDLGGPFNKTARVIANGFWANHTISLTARVIPTIVPSMGMGIAVFIDKILCGRRVFDTTLKKSGPNSFILSFFGISEGGLPFLFRNPIITICINVIGGTLGAFLGIAFGTEQWFPDSAIWAWPFASPVWGLLLAQLISVSFIAIAHVYVRYFAIKLKWISEPVIISPTIIKSI